MKIDLMQLEFIDIKLRKMATELEVMTRLTFEVTSLYRIGDDGVHGTLPLRGIDLGCSNINIGEQIEKFVNDLWQYDPTRPSMKCAMVHNVSSGLHLHLQVHPNTKKR